MDMERARFARRGIIEMLNSRGEWEPRPEHRRRQRLGDTLVFDEGALEARALPPPHARSARPRRTVQTRFRARQTLWPRAVRSGCAALARLKLAPVAAAASEAGRTSTPPRSSRKFSRRLPELMKQEALSRESGRTPPSQPARKDARKSAGSAEGNPVASLVTRGDHLFVRLDYSASKPRVDRPIRPRACSPLPSAGNCRRSAAIARSLPPFARRRKSSCLPAYAWRRLGLIDAAGVPTRRGILFSFFHQWRRPRRRRRAGRRKLSDRGTGFRSRQSPRRAALRRRRFAVRRPARARSASRPMSGPICRDIWTWACRRNTARARARRFARSSCMASRARKLITDTLRQGDIERAIIEWRSLLRHILAAPDYDFARWRELKAAAAHHIEASVSPSMLSLPPLTASQQRRV